MASFDIIRKNGDRHTVLVDDCDLDLVTTSHKWYVGFGSAGKRKIAYVATNISGSEKRLTKQFLHRFLFDWPDSKLQVDHINGNGLDNRRSNLRLCSATQNMANTRRSVNNTSGYKGVSWHKRANRWMASISIGGVRTYIGYFATAEKAYEAYCSAAKERGGEFFNPG